MAAQLGDLLLCRSAPAGWREALYRWAVCWATDSPVNHVVICTGFDTDGEPLVLSVEIRGVVIRRAEHYRESVWVNLPLTDQQRRVVVATARLMAGHYSWGKITRLALAQPRMGAWIARQRPARLLHGRGVVCSEVASAALRAAGVSLLPWPDCMVSPGDIWRAKGRPSLPI